MYKTLLFEVPVIIRSPITLDSQSQSYGFLSIAQTNEEPMQVVAFLVFFRMDPSQNFSIFNRDSGAMKGSSFHFFQEVAPL